MTDLTVANTIRAQIGRGALFMMGAKDFVGSADSLTFKVRGSKKCNAITVKLEADDTYTITFKKVVSSRINRKTWEVRPGRIDTVKELSGVYCDGLCQAFEMVTGLATKL